MDTQQLVNQVLAEKRAKGYAESYMRPLRRAAQFLVDAAPTTEDFGDDAWAVLQEHLNAEDWAPQTRQAMAIQIKCFVNYAVANDIVDHRVTRTFPSYRCGMSTLETMKDDEFDRLLGVTKSPQMRAALLLAFDAGLRTTEAVSLRAEDVDFTSDTIRLRRRKGGDSQRLPILTDRLRAALADAIAVVPHHGYLALDPRGQAQRPRRPFQYDLTALCDKAGIRRLSFHTLRRGFAYWSATRGLDGHPASVVAISRALNHKSLLITQRYLTEVGADAEGIRRDYGGRAPVGVHP